MVFTPLIEKEKIQILSFKFRINLRDKRITAKFETLYWVTIMQINKIANSSVENY